MVVVGEPAVKGCGPFVACAVDGGVGPAGEHRADEAFGLPVCLRSVGAGAEVFDAEAAAGDGVDGGAVGAAVVCEYAFDPDAVASEEAKGADEEARHGGRFLVREHLGVGESAVVVDGDVDVLPSDLSVLLPGCIGDSTPVVAPNAAEAFPCSVLDPAEFLHVDVDELARAGALVADGRLEPEPAEPAEAFAAQHSRDRRERHQQRFGDLGTREPEPAQRDDHGNTFRRGAVGDLMGRRGAIRESLLAFRVIAVDPLTSTADADASGISCRRHRPPLLKHSPSEQPAPLHAERRVTVKLHPVSSL